MKGQWRTNHAGPYAMDYTPLFRLLDMHYPNRDDWLQAFEDIQFLESVALAEMNKE